MFTWRFFLNRLQTKDELEKRGIVSGSHYPICPLCFSESESHLHRFLLCPKVVLVWYKILDWISLGYLPPCGIILLHVTQFDKKLEINIKKEFRLFLWFATIRVIWLSRNDILFQRGQKDVNDLVSLTKSLSWEWVCVRFKGVLCVIRLFGLLILPLIVSIISFLRFLFSLMVFPIILGLTIPYTSINTLFPYKKQSFNHVIKMTLKWMED